MKDHMGRKIDYMRVSITDRCNLRCRYCMPEDLPQLPHSDILRYEEILRLCALAGSLGIRTIKVTGGEPLARRGCMDFLTRLCKIPGIENVTLTTNGVLLEHYIETLAGLGINRINISLDTLNPDTYRQITGKDSFDAVWRSFQAALGAGLRLKINTVPIRGVNDNELAEIAAIAEQYPVDVRFIELMPTGGGSDTGRITGEEVLDRLRQKYDLVPDCEVHGFGPASYYHSGELQGSIGLITAVSNHFCSGCNRVRLTSEGYLKLCLYHDDGVDLRSMLRGGSSDIEMMEAMSDAISRKPAKHCFEVTDATHGIRNMSKIGG